MVYAMSFIIHRENSPWLVCAAYGKSSEDVSRNEVLLCGGYYGQVAPLYPAQSDLTSGSLVAAGSIGIVALAASAAMAVKAEQKKIKCEKKLQTQEQSFDDLLEGKEDVEKQLKEAKEELQLNKDKQMACQTPGYFVHPVLGCIGIIISPRTAEQWAMRCAEDGGELILINSASENQALANLMNNFGVHVVIQGKRETISSPWVTEDGQPLPYIGQFESVENNPNTLHIAVKPDGKWVKERPDWVFVFAVCEIET